MPTTAYQRPASLDRALGLLAERRWTVLAGGTDIYPAHVGRPLSEPLLDVSALTELRGVRLGADGGWRIGALTTWSDLVRASGAGTGTATGADGEPAGELFAGLAAAAREIGGVQIQNQATIGGNLCNASPAADGVPMLSALDAQVELRSGQGVRSLPISQFVLGNRRTALRPDELLTAITIPAYSARALSRFRKLGHRRYLVISIAMVAVVLDFDERQRASRCGIAIGSCSIAARRVVPIEQALLDVPRRELAQRLRQVLAAEDPLTAVLAPIDDIRGTAAYRLHAARELLQRCFDDIADES